MKNIIIAIVLVLMTGCIMISYRVDEEIVADRVADSLITTASSIKCLNNSIEDKKNNTKKSFDKSPTETIKKKPIKPNAKKIETISRKLNTNNPEVVEIYDLANEYGKKYNVPPEIIFAVAFVESEFKQFENGKPFIEYNGIGIMQITPGKEEVAFDLERVKYDYKYNIETGVKILRAKWDNKNIAKFENNDPSILENWYFAIWAYNGYSEENNPNNLPMYSKSLKIMKKKAYQEKVIDGLENTLSIKVTKVNKVNIPKTIRETKNMILKTPRPMHYSILRETNNNGEFAFLEKGSEK